MAASSQPLENGRTLESFVCAPPGLSLKDGPLNNMKLELIRDSKENKINDTAKSHHSLVDGKLLAEGNFSENFKAKSPHSYCKYLRQIIFFPKWKKTPSLMTRNGFPLPELKAEEAPQVWAETLWIESTEIFDMPYVRPF